MGSGGSKPQDSKRDEKAGNEGRRIYMPVDGSVASERAVRWAMTNIVKPEDDVHVTTFVAHQSPFVGMDELVKDVVEHDDLDDKGMKAAEGICKKYTDIVHNMHEAKECKASEKSVTCEAVRYMPSATSASGVGPTIVTHAHEAHADVIVMGSRGLGAIQRSLLRTLGLGSASDYTVHNSEVPVVVVKPTHNDIKSSKK